MFLFKGSSVEQLKERKNCVKLERFKSLNGFVKVKEAEEEVSSPCITTLIYFITCNT